jgi:hypothetical protein
LTEAVIVQGLFSDRGKLKAHIFFLTIFIFESSRNLKFESYYNLQELEKEIRQPLLEVRENLTSVLTKADRIPQESSGMPVEKFAASTVIALPDNCLSDYFKCQ